MNEIEILKKQVNDIRQTQELLLRTCKKLIDKEKTNSDIIQVISDFLINEGLDDVNMESDVGYV